MQIRYTGLLAALLFIAAGTASVNARETGNSIYDRLGGGDPTSGKIKSEKHLCQECHGERGDSPTAGAPKLTGQQAPYIFKQLKNFQSGERNHPVMNVMAAEVPEKDLLDIAAYFSVQEKMAGKQRKEFLHAKQLFQGGDWNRNILACKTCHGDNGKGSNGAYPIIGGQYAIYLREQLLHWRSGERSNSDGDVMHTVSKLLTDAEIEDLSDYISGF
ncbi:MAG: hypothetical protein RIR18_2447 [Pseudomonadota bacterium]|jgi:cytochrome c553